MLPIYTFIMVKYLKFALLHIFIYANKKQIISPSCPSVRSPPLLNRFEPNMEDWFHMTLVARRFNLSQHIRPRSVINITVFIVPNSYVRLLFLNFLFYTHFCNFFSTYILTFSEV